jgi:Fe-S-cluster containining protein
MSTHMSRKYMLSDSLRAQLKLCNDEERAQVVEALEFYVEQFTQLQHDHADNPLGLAASIQDAVDRALAEHRKAMPEMAAKIRCQKGCSYCCEHFVGIMPVEGVLLRAYAAELGLAIDEARLGRQAGRTEQTWRELDPTDRRCVFLQEDGSCGVYDHRPMACRKFLVIDDPIKCKSSHAWRYVAASAEIIATAAMTVFGMELMAEVLRRVAP